MATGTEGVKVSLGEGLRCDLTARGHRLLADEPESLGGTDEGATPSELFLASLGACTAITLRMYAERKGWPLDGVEVELSQAFVTREDWEDWPEGEKRKRLPRITRRITIRGDLDGEQVERLEHIARRCPVHRTITENPVVVDEVEVRG